MSWLVDTLLVTGGLIALVLVLRRPVSRTFGPATAYALWSLPLLRLIIPPITLPSAPAEAAPVLVTVLADPVPATAAPAAVWTFAPLFQTVWLAGALAYLGWRVWQYRVMRRTLLAGAIGVGEAEGVRLIEAPEVRSPVAFGLRDRVVALPPGFMALTPQRERDLAIAHELEHHRGRDLAVNIAMQPLLALHWFNPLAWAGWRALRRDQEAACDARVLAGREADTRAAYGRLIAAFACNPSPALASPLACPILHEKSIVHRLRSLTMTEPTKTRRLAGRLLIGAAALALPLTATITYAGGEEPAPAASGKSDAIVTHGIVIIDVPKGTSPDDKDLHVRTVVRDGKTIVLKTKQPLSDAEAEARIAKAEAELPMPPMPPVDGPAEHSRHIVIVRDHSGASDASAGKGGKQEVRTVMLHAPGAGGGHAKMMHGDGAMADCGGSKPVTAVTESGAGDQKTRRVMVFCTKGGDKTAALGGMRKAREQVAADPNIPADARAEALKELDAEIARLEKGA